jgi:hypothetical protein
MLLMRTLSAFLSGIFYSLPRGTIIFTDRMGWHSLLRIQEAIGSNFGRGTGYPGQISLEFPKPSKLLN